MTGAADPVEPIAGFYAPVHRALTEPILLGGAPRALAIVNGTLAGAIGLGLRHPSVGARTPRHGREPSVSQSDMAFACA